MDTALLFPGQGSQEAAMGRDLAEADKECMELWKKAERISGLDLRAIYWEGDAGAMAQTSHLQPALTVVNLNLWRKLSSKLKPAATAGHSLGEFSALAAAGVLPTEIILELVSLRGRLMRDADPQGKGAMAAIVRLPLAQVQECVAETAASTGETILIANYNSPAQFVASGTKTAIAHIQKTVAEQRGRALPLAVSGAFHSPLMQDAAREFADAINSIRPSTWNTAAFDVYCNASPAPLRDCGAIKDLMIRQMTSSVFWIDTIVRQWDSGCRLFVECGPKGVLSKMTGLILQEHAPSSAIHSKEAPAWHSINVGSMHAAEEFAACPSA